MADKRKRARGGPARPSKGSGQTRSRAFPVTRRAVLGGSLAGTVAAVAQNIPTRPTVRQNGDVAEVEFGEAWTIDATKFDNAALAPLVPIDGGWRIQLVGKRPGTHPTFRGCDLWADMAFDVIETGGQWYIEIKLRMFAEKRRAKLADWCLGIARAEWSEQVGGIKFGGMADLQSFAATLTFGRDLGLRYDLRSPSLLVHKRFAATVKRVIIPPPAHGIINFEFGGVFPRASDLSLNGAGGWSDTATKNAAKTLAREAIVIGGLKNQILMASFGTDPKLRIELSGDGLLMKTVLTDADASLVIAGAGLKNDRAAIKLGAFAMVSRFEARRETVGFTLQIRDTVQSVATDRFVIGLTGRGLDPTVLAPDGFLIAETLEMKVGLTDVSAAAANGQLCEASFGRTTKGKLADPGLLPRPEDMVGAPTMLLLGARPPSPLPGAGRLQVRLGTNGFLNLDMESGRLRLRRMVDGFDLGFGFVGYALIADSGKTRLVPIAGHPERLQLVHFWPQHLLEEAFTTSPSLLDALKARAFGEETEAVGRRKVPTLEPVTFANGYKKSRLARTRASGPTRIVFDRGKKPAAPIDATIAALTAWSDLPLRTDKRATRATLGDDGKVLTLDRQIVEVAGITPTMKRDEAREAVRLSFGAADDPRKGRISQQVTALELVTGLQFSPSRDATFRVTAEPAGVATLTSEQWSATLSLPTGAVVRAIMASDLDLGMFVSPKPTDIDKDDAPFVSSINRADRREIVTLSSGFGIAALRALKIDAAGNPRDRDTSLVALPADSYSYLTPPKPGQVAQEGVMAPKPFSHFGARLTPFGADIDIEWTGEPPLPVRPDAFFDPGFRVERYTHRTRVARDVFTEVQYKGYLFPLGFRASLIKVTRREAHYDAELGWIYPLIQREYIVTTNPNKKINGPYHPFAARDMHAVSLTMHTVTTPFLDDDASSQSYVPLSGAMKAFWVRVGSQDFDFEYSADGLTGTRQMPMLFLDNSVIGDPAVMKAVIDKYQLEPYDLGAERGARNARRVERFNASETMFAPSAKIGDTIFETEATALSVRPRLSDLGTPEYTMDAFMEGADQPPFYAFMERGRIRVRALERLTGLPTSRVDVRYYDGYRDAGFDPTSNAGEIFLEVVTPGVGLGLGAKGGATGGVARPEAALAALSRSSGLIGGRESQKVVKKPAALLADDTEAKTEVSYDISAAAGGKFDPAQFFKGATLLGIVPLDLIVKAAAIAAAPLMKEVTEVAALSRESAVRIADLLDGAIKAADDAETSANTAIAGYLGGAPGQDYTLAAIYPDLVGALTIFKTKLRSLASELRTSGAATDLLTSAPPVLQAWPPLRSAIDQIARDPMPTVVKDAITELKKQVDMLFALFKEGNDPASVIARALLAEIERDLYDKLAAALAVSGAAEVLFGPVGSVLNPDPWDVAFPHSDPTKPPILRQIPLSKEEVRDFLRDLANDPAAAGAALGAGIVEREFGIALVDLLAMIARFADGDARAIAWPRRAIERALVDRLLAKLKTVASQSLLEAARQAKRSITARETISEIEASAAEIARLRDAALAKASRACIAAILSRLEAAGTPPTDPTQLRAWIERQVGGAKTGIVEALGVLTADLPDATAAAALRGQEWTKSANQLKLKLDAALKPEDRDALKPLWSRADALAQRAAAHLAALQTLALALASEARRREIADEIVNGVVAALAGIVPKLPRIEERGAALVQRLTGLLGKIERFADTWQTAAARAGMAWCGTNATSIVSICTALIRDFVPSVAIRQAELNNLADLAARLDLPRSLDPILLAGIRDAGANLRGTISELASALARLETARVAMLGSMPTALTCSEAAEALRPIRELYQLWRAAFLAGDRMVEQVGRFQTALLAAEMLIAEDVLRRFVQQGGPNDPTNSTVVARVGVELKKLDQLRTDIRTICAHATAVIALVAGADTIDKPWKDLVTKLAAQLPVEDRKSIEQRIAEVRALVTAIDRAAATPEKLRVNADLARRAVEGAIVDLLGRIASYAMLGGDAAAQVGLIIERIAGAAIQPVGSAVQQALAATKEINRGLTGGSGLAAIAQMLGAPLLKKLADVESALQKDAAALQAATIKPVAPKFLVILGGWRSSTPGLLAAARTIEEIFGAIAQGQIGRLVDFGLAKRAIEDALADILPTKARIDYFWGSDLSPFPSNDPVFAMEPSIAYQPSAEEKELPPGDLAIVTRTEIDFRKPGKPKLNAYGRLKPFSIHLLGSAFDLVTIRFKGAYFKVKDGGSPEFSADIEGVTIGPMLQFLQALAPFMGGRPDNGLYAYPILSPPGFEVGYRFSSDTIQLGSLQFINVSLLVSAMLPFDARHAEFRFEFASRERPFLIASPPYGGGGSVALVANARGITRFELQFEFGAVMDLRIGPFKGHGRITAGIYIAFGGGNPVLEGFVHAVGEGSVACFSLTINIEVRVRHANGSMVGSSTYRVEFRVGFAKFKYSITARYKISGDSGGGMQALGFRGTTSAEAEGQPIHILMPNPARIEDWGAYRELFGKAW